MQHWQCQALANPIRLKIRWEWVSDADQRQTTDERASSLADLAMKALAVRHPLNFIVMLTALGWLTEATFAVLFENGEAA